MTSHEDFSAYLDHLARSKAPTRTLIVLPDDGVGPVLAFIGAATRSLRVKIFTLDHPAIIEALLDAHARGVAVRVMLNPQKADDSRTNDATMALLQEHQVAVRWTNPGLAISHEKSLVADDESALLGTFNFGVKYFTKTRDVGVITRDAAQVREIAGCFDADWERVPAVLGDAPGLVWSVGNARRAMAALIDGARRSLDVAHTKFVDAVIVERLVRACSRKVKVRILTGNVLRLLDAAESVAALRVLQSKGAEIRYSKRPKMHAKLLLADNRQALVGSHNILRSAFDSRRELGVVLSESTLVRRLKQIYAADWKQAKCFKLPDPLDVLEGTGGMLSTLPTSISAEDAHFITGDTA